MVLVKLLGACAVVLRRSALAAVVLIAGTAGAKLAFAEHQLCVPYWRWSDDRDNSWEFTACRGMVTVVRDGGSLGHCTLTYPRPVPGGPARRMCAGTTAHYELVAPHAVCASLRPYFHAMSSDPGYVEDDFYCDDEPDYEAIMEARAEARAERDLERAEREYERYVYGD